MSDAREHPLPEGQAPATTADIARHRAQRAPAGAPSRAEQSSSPTRAKPNRATPDVARGQHDGIEHDGGERAEELQVLQEVSDIALSHLSLETLLPCLLERLCAVLAVDNAAIFLASDDGRFLSMQVAHGPEEAVVGQVRFPIGEGVAGQVAATREPVIVDDLSVARVAHPFIQEHLRSLMGVPLLLGDRLLGVLDVATVSSHSFTERDVRLLRLVADRVALAIDRARLYAEADRARREAQALSTRLAEVLDAVPSVLSLHDAQGRIVRLNAMARAMAPERLTADRLSADAGVDAEWGPVAVEDLTTLLGLRTPDGEGMKRGDTPVDRALRGERVEAVEMRRLLSDGHVRDLLVGAAPIYDSDGHVDGVVSVSRDVTALRVAERQAAERASILLATFEAMTDAMIVCDASCRVVRMNSAGRKLFFPSGASAKAGGTPVPEHFPRQGDAEEMGAMGAMGVNRLLERMRNADGHPFPPDQSPVARVLRGEALTGARVVDALLSLEDSQDGVAAVALSISGAPIRREDGTVDGFVLVARDVTERRRLEREVAARVNQLETIIESMADGVFVYDGRGHIVQTNAAARDLFAVGDHPEYLTRTLEERVPSVETRDAEGRPLPPDHWPQRRVLRGEVLAGEQTTDYRLRVLDGHEVIVNVSGGPLRASDGSIAGGVLLLRDVTTLRRLEQRNQEALDALLAMAHALVAPDVDASDASDAPDVPAGPNAVAPESSEHGDRAEEVEQAEQAERTDQTERTEQAERAAREVATRLAELTRGVLGCRRVGLQVIDPETAFMRPLAVVGLSAIHEQQWWAEQEEHPTRYGDGADPAMTARLAAGEALALDLTVPPFDAQPNPFGITTMLVAPLRIGSDVVGILTLDYDGERHLFTADELALAEAVGQFAALVIERERLQRERATAQAHELALLTVNQRMDEFLGMAAHDLKTPVAGSKLNAQVAIRRAHRLAAQLQSASAPRTEGKSDLTMAEVGAQVHDLLRALEHVEQGMDRLSRLVERLLDVSRIRTGKLVLRPEVGDVTPLVRECVEEQQMIAPSRLFQLDIQATSPLLAEIDPERIRQVVTNYLTNAQRYSPEDRPIEVSVTTTGDHVRVAVRDHGAGIPPEEREAIWQRFERASSAQQQNGNESGLGLGLFISREILQQHGGQVGVVSTVGEGSTFWFTLPLANSRTGSLTETGESR